MKFSLILLTLLSTSLSFAGEKKEKITCYAGGKKVSESLRTTLSDENIESRSARTILFDAKTKTTSTQQELVIVAIEKKGNLEIQTTNGTYVVLSDKVNVQKIVSTDTYLAEGHKKTLVKSVVGGQELKLFSTDTEIQLNPYLKVYSSVLKDTSIESASLQAQYTCTMELL